MSTPATRPLAPADLPAPWSSDPFVVEDFHRWTGVRAWGGAEAMLFACEPRPGVRSWIGVGAPAPLARLVEAMPDGAAPTVVSLTRGTWDQVDPVVLRDLGLTTASRWDWLWTDEAPPAQPGESGVHELDPVADRDAILAVQAEAVPDTHMTLDRDGSRWFGWRDHDGVLRAVAGSTGWDRTVHLGSIATSPAWRGRGLGAAVTAAITREGLARTGRVALGVYADNAVALRLYARLGFAVGQRVETRRRPA